MVILTTRYYLINFLQAKRPCSRTFKGIKISDIEKIFKTVTQTTLFIFLELDILFSSIKTTRELQINSAYREKTLKMTTFKDAI